MLASVRNVPFLIWNETTDELVPIAGVLEQVKTFDELGYRYEFDQFQAGEHLTLAINDEYAPAAAFLGTETVDADPAHVTYVYNPTMDFPADGTRRRARLLGLRRRAARLQRHGAAGQGRRALAGLRRRRSRCPGATQHGAGVLTGGQIPAIPYTSQSKAWGPAPSEPASDALNIAATNVAHVTIDAARAKVDCKAHLNVTTDGPLTVTLADCQGGGGTKDPAHELRRNRDSGGGTGPRRRSATGADRRPARPGAILGPMPSLLDRALNVGEAKKYKTYQKRVALINAFEPELEHDSDAELRERMDVLRERAADGESLEALLPECFAIVRETGKRTMGMRHFDVQLIGAMALHDGQIAEMKTGEGKTLTATLAVVLNSLAVRELADSPAPGAAAERKGVHLVTVNDYLARRDAEWMSPIYDAGRVGGRCSRP